MALLVDFWEWGRAMVQRGIARLQGPSWVQESTKGEVSSLSIHTVQGYDLSICVEATYYERRYERFYMPSRLMASYHVYTLVPPEAPERLRMIAGNFTADIPRPYTWANEIIQKQGAIEAYLDVLISRLDRRSTSGLIFDR
ncbi:hypothetical protein AWB81_01846 [Caballeronia arationis]|uniref:hypothetical protein n=1 Tax=Caballeronia arationis TaxID=1777142 RepID=UPI00074B66F2|nr:hypothetical protein [Caballeronia arationis]SAK59443.1 hypothetical protein AWB81_01846 [Caballeronia arationis]